MTNSILGHGAFEAVEKETKYSHKKKVFWSDGKEGIINSAAGLIQIFTNKSHVLLNVDSIVICRLHVNLLYVSEEARRRHTSQRGSITAYLSVSFETCCEADEA